jgi:hypothetical protein
LYDDLESVLKDGDRAQDTNNIAPDVGGMPVDGRDRGLAPRALNVEAEVGKVLLLHRLLDGKPRLNLGLGGVCIVAQIRSI